MTEKEALREGYQSDIHHTNLSLGSGPASREAPEVVWSVRVCVCVREMAGAGVTPHAQNRGCRGGGREVSAQVSWLSWCRVEGSAEH